MGRREAAEAAGVHLCELHVWSVQAHFASHPAHGSCKSPEAFWAVAIACTLAAMNSCVSGCFLPPGVHYTAVMLHAALFFLLTVARQDWHAIKPQTSKIINKKLSPEIFREASDEGANAVNVQRQ